MQNYLQATGFLMSWLQSKFKLTVCWIKNHLATSLLSVVMGLSQMLIFFLNTCLLLLLFQTFGQFVYYSNRVMQCLHICTEWWCLSLSCGFISQRQAICLCCLDITLFLANKFMMMALVMCKVVLLIGSPYPKIKFLIYPWCYESIWMVLVLYTCNQKTEVGRIVSIRQENSTACLYQMLIHNQLTVAMEYIKEKYKNPRLHTSYSI